MEVKSNWRPPRSCDTYWSEFVHCKSFKNRFHQYYAFGDFPSCRPWKEDYKSCRAWEKNKDETAKEALRTSEGKRLAEQNLFPPVWEMRKVPPSDWNDPLYENDK